jgi:glycosyltransferase involved in cell wall biosynthesis
VYQDRAPGRRRLRVAMLAPPWIPIPAPAYGGIEEVVRLLCEEIVERGHDVTLFVAPGSNSPADVSSPLPHPHPDEIGSACHEADHVARAFSSISEAEIMGERYDVVHDHCGFMALAMADRIDTPFVHTVHGPFGDDVASFYAAHGHKGTIVALSHAQAERAPDRMGPAEVVPNPLRVSEWPFRADKEDWALWIGRMSSVKGPHRAIAAAREAGIPLVLAGPVQPGQEEFFEREVQPHVDGDAVRYIGEADGARKRELYGAARAVLMPIRWEEPFGLVMAEAMACGTPVIAFPEGAAPEIVLDGETGFLGNDEHEMARALSRSEDIDPQDCRDHVAARFDAGVVAERYKRVYVKAIVRANADSRVRRFVPRLTVVR